MMTFGMMAKARAGVLYIRSLLAIYFMYSSMYICQLLNDMVLLTVSLCRVDMRV